MCQSELVNIYSIGLIFNFVIVRQEKFKQTPFTSGAVEPRAFSAQTWHILDIWYYGFLFFKSQMLKHLKFAHFAISDEISNFWCHSN